MNARGEADPGSDAIRWNDLERALAKRVLSRLANEQPAENSWRVGDDVTFRQLVELWLGGMTGQLDPGTVGLLRLHLSTHLIPYFGTLQGITKASVAEYGRRRLAAVKRKTLQKERSTLRGFLAWCHEQGHLSDPLELPALPRRAPGTPYHVRRRGLATELTPDECAALLAGLPEWSTPRGGKSAFPVRARFIVAYETSLRPATLDALSVPEHYHRGADRLVIPDELDKARFGRVLPLTDAARAALDSVVGDAGPIFGRHDYRQQLDRVASRVLDPQRARAFTGYDFRHARLTHLAETGNLPGVAYMAGHKRVTTTAIYVKPGLRAANAVLGTVAGAAAQATEDGARMVRALAELTSAELQALQHPETHEQLLLEWQLVVHTLAELREKDERAAARRAATRRGSSPRDDAGLDALVEHTIGTREFTQQHELRACVGCCLRRLRASLKRLTAAGRIQLVKTPSRLGGIRHVWRRGIEGPLTAHRRRRAGGGPSCPGE